MIAIDTETRLIRPGLLAPDLVCVSYATETESGVVHRTEAAAFMRSIAGELLVLHNAAFDVAVLCTHEPSLYPLLVDAYEEDRVHDTYLQEQLESIKRGTLDRDIHKRRFSLSALSEQYTGAPLNKGADTWRLRYGELIDVPVEDWPEDARQYAIDDAAATRDVYRQQPRSPDHGLQARAHLALHTMSCWGVRTDRGAVRALATSLQTTMDRLRDTAPFLRTNGTLDTKALQYHVECILGDAAPRTPTGRVQINRDTLEQVGGLEELLEYKATQKLLSTYVPVLEQGIDRPITARYNPLVATGRTSCSGPNLQNPPRVAGVRECYVPRDGHVYAACDYSSAELCALAQVTYSMFGHSHMRDAIQSGQDLHVAVAATILGWSYDETHRAYKDGSEDVKTARQLAKHANFGLAGGMGPDSFVRLCRQFGTTITRQRAQEIKRGWLRTWPELAAYFRHISAVTSELGDRAITQYGSQRLRGGVTYCQAANTYFQGLVADAAKDALWHVHRRCYDERLHAPMYGCRPVLFLHDEIILEAPEAAAHEAAMDLSETMNAIAQRWMPDVPIKSEPVLMTRWTKNARQVWRDGRLAW